jgi:acetyltransferase-like isoleucine patch superfamily enzyme
MHMDPRRSPPGVRLGAGTLIDDDVRLGNGAGASGRSKGLEIGRGAVIRSGSSVFDGVRIGDRLATGHNVSIGENTVIGSDCHIGNNSIIAAGCTIGDRVHIDANCYIAESTTIEDDARVAPGVYMANDPHPGSKSDLCRRGPTIERGAQIGMNVTILPFVTIGERSLVGAGSVVTRNVAAGLVVVGNPARVLKSVTQVTCPLDLPDGDYLRRREER